MRDVFGAVNEQLEDLRQELEMEMASNELAQAVEEAVELFESEGYELDDDLTLDDLIEAAEDMLEKVGGVGVKFTGSDRGGKKTPSGMKMVFGRLVKIGKQFAKKLGFGKAKVKPKRRPNLKKNYDFTPTKGREGSHVDVKDKKTGRTMWSVDKKDANKSWHAKKLKAASKSLSQQGKKLKRATGGKL
jgi:hypothetical protein